MYSQKNRQFILKQSSGKVWNFFYDDKHGICYSTMTRRNTWTEPVALQRNAYSSFYVDLDYEDCFHLLFQDKEGNILYSYIENENIRTTPVLTSRVNTIYNKYFYLVPLKNNIQLFYIIEHGEQLLLAHQTIADGKPSNPKVIDYVIQGEVPYTAVLDRSGSLYAFYQTSDGRYYQLGYKKYMPANKLWGEYTAVTRYSGDCDSPRVVCDVSGVIHICYQRRSEKEFELVYQQKTPERNIWSEEVIICSSAYTFTNNAILLSNDNLVIYWVREDIIQYSSSSNKGSSWTRPARFNFSMGRQLFCINYKSNYPYENDKIISRDIPGNFIGGFTLAFYQDSSSNIYNLSAEELRTMIVDTLKLLKGNMEEMRETISVLKADITDLRAAQRHLEKEVSKYTIRKTMGSRNSNEIKNTKPSNEPSYTDLNITDEQALELMKKEFLAENNRDISYSDTMEKEILQRKAGSEVSGTNDNKIIKEADSIVDQGAEQMPDPGDDESTD